MSEILYNFLSDLTKMNLQYGDRVQTIMLGPDKQQIIQARGQDQYKNLLIEASSRHPIPELTLPGCLGRLNHLQSALSIMGDRKLKVGAKIIIEGRKASDGKTDIIGSMTFVTGRTKAQYIASDPFRNKLGTKSNRVAITDWPVEFEIDGESVAAFDEAYKIHLSTGSGSKDDLVLLKHEDDEIKLVFGEVEGIKSDPKTETILSRKIKGTSEGIKLVLPAPTLRATMKAMGPDGGIAKLAPLAVSVKSETLYAIYTITLTGKNQDS